MSFFSTTWVFSVYCHRGVNKPENITSKYLESENFDFKRITQTIPNYLTKLLLMNVIDEVQLPFKRSTVNTCAAGQGLKLDVFTSMRNIKRVSLITQCSIRPLRAHQTSMSVHLRRGVDGGVARGTLRDAGTVVDDVLVAVGALAALLLPLAFVVEILAEGERDAAPALEGEVVGGAALHTGVFVLEAAAGHAVTGRVGLRAAAQALVVAALVVLGAGSMFTMNRAHCKWEINKKVKLVKKRWQRWN